MTRIQKARLIVKYRQSNFEAKRIKYRDIFLNGLRRFINKVKFDYWFQLPFILLKIGVIPRNDIMLDVYIKLGIGHMYTVFRGGTDWNPYAEPKKWGSTYRSDIWFRIMIHFFFWNFWLDIYPQWYHSLKLFELWNTNNKREK
jgi:hypothetical protein